MTQKQIEKVIRIYSENASLGAFIVNCKKERVFRKAENVSIKYAYKWCQENIYPITLGRCQQYKSIWKDR